MWNAGWLSFLNRFYESPFRKKNRKMIILNFGHNHIINILYELIGSFWTIVFHLMHYLKAKSSHIYKPNFNPFRLHTYVCKLRPNLIRKIDPLSTGFRRRPSVCHSQRSQNATGRRYVRVLWRPNAIKLQALNGPWDSRGGVITSTSDCTVFYTWITWTCDTNLCRLVATCQPLGGWTEANYSWKQAKLCFCFCRYETSIERVKNHMCAKLKMT
jgi:hypothetical protein